MSVLTVDLGTSNTVAVLAAHGQPPRVVEVDGSTMMPSAVFAEEGGRLVVGKEAERRARTDPARYEPNPKRRVDEGTLLLGDSVVPVTDAFGAVLRRIADEVKRQLSGAAPDEVRLTHPAQWGPVRRNVLLSAARQAGLGQNLVLVPEPVAAAAHFASFQELGKALAVYDLGAGTFDVAVVGATQQGYVVLAEAGLADLGGLDVDQALLEHIGRQVAAKDPARWERVLRPESTVDRRAQRALREDVRAGKEALSTHPQTEIALPEPFEDVLVTRAELEELITAGLLRSVELVAATIRSAGLSPDRLAGIYLVGGSSRIPLVAMLIARHLGVVPVNLDQPESAVARGALHVSKDGVSLRTGAVADGQPGPRSGGLPVSQPFAVQQPPPGMHPGMQAQQVAPGRQVAPQHAQQGLQPVPGQQLQSGPLPVPGQQLPPGPQLVPVQQQLPMPQQVGAGQLSMAAHQMPVPQQFQSGPQQAYGQPQQMSPQAQWGQPAQPHPGQPFPAAMPPNGMGWQPGPYNPMSAGPRPTALIVLAYVTVGLSLLVWFWPVLAAAVLLLIGAVSLRQGQGSVCVLLGSAVAFGFTALLFLSPLFGPDFFWNLEEVTRIPSPFLLDRFGWLFAIAVGLLSLTVLILTMVWRARRPGGHGTIRPVPHWGGNA